MRITGRREEFLLRAEEVDERAQRAEDPEIKDTWRTVADCYRDLAARAANQPYVRLDREKSGR
jgi:hypothetical protein